MRTLAIIVGVALLIGMIVTGVVLLLSSDDEQVATAPTTAPTTPPPATEPPGTAEPPDTTVAEPPADPTTTVDETDPTTTDSTTTDPATTVDETTTTTVAGGDGPLPGDCPGGTIVPGGEMFFGTLDATLGATICLAIEEPSVTQVRVEAEDDTTLTIFRDGIEIAFDDDTFGLDPAITRAFEPGVHVLVVELFSSFDAGTVPFVLNATSLDTTDDGCEPGLTMLIPGEIDGNVDNDLGRLVCLVVEEPGVHEVRVEADLDTTLTVFRDGEEIDFDDDTYGLDPAITRAFEPGVHVLMVSNYSMGIADNPFTMTID